MYMISFSSKDLPFFFNEQLQNFYYYPYVWDSTRGNGFGEDISGVLWLRTFIYTFSGFLHSYLGLDWFGITIVYYSLFLIFSLVSIYYFVKVLFTWNWAVFIVSFLLYGTNTYILMLMHGGQLGVMLAYSIAPLVLGRFISLIRLTRVDYKSIIATAFVFSLQILMDIRIVYVTFVIVVIYICFHTLKQLMQKKPLLLTVLSVNILICLIIAALLHAFWIVPAFIFLNDVMKTGGENVSVEFLSFALFENSLSLLHPNWPENIFGKVYFMKPSFILLPILAFFSLLTLSKKAPKKDTFLVLFFTVVALGGAFLAKGTNEQFGSIYLWLYDFIPGFSLFRDPTKWYAVVAIAYAYLIPFTIQKRSVLLYGLFVLFWGYLLFPIFQNAHTGVFPRVVSDEYIKLKDELIKDTQFSRVLWIPTVSRYGYSSSTHPAVSFEDFFKVLSASAVIKSLKRDTLIDILDTYSIGYIVMPYGVQYETLLKEKGYTQKKVEELKNILSGKKELKEIYKYQDLSVFKVAEQKDLFWCIGKCRVQLYSRINPTQYEITLENVRIGDKLVFSQANNKHWILEADKQSEPDTYNSLMTFHLSKSGTYSARLVYQKQNLADMGFVVSGVTLVSLSVFFLLDTKKAGNSNS